MSTPKLTVSAVLLTYNSEKFVEAAIRGLFEQDHQIDVIISDDASDDRTYDILSHVLADYDGPHKVRLRRRARNSGSKSAHLNDAFQYVSSDVVVSFDADDVSHRSRVTKLVQVFQTDERIKAVYSSYLLIDEHGRHLSRGSPPHRPPTVSACAWFARVGAFASGGTLAVRREVIDAFGRLPPDVHEDVVLPFRASLLGDVRYLDEPLVDVRRHGEALTQSYGHFDSLDDYRSRFRWGVERTRRQCDVRLDDLEHAKTLRPRRREELQPLEDIVIRSMEQAEISLGLVSRSLWVRCRTFLELLRSPWYDDDRLRDFCLVFMPRIYLLLKRHSLGSGATPMRQSDTPG